MKTKNKKQVANNPGKTYCMVLPNNEEGRDLVKKMKKALSPDRRIRLRGQGAITNGKSHKDYPYGAPLSASSHMRVVMEYRPGMDPGRAYEDRLRKEIRETSVYKNHYRETAIRTLRSLIRIGNMGEYALLCADLVGQDELFEIQHAFMATLDRLAADMARQHEVVDAFPFMYEKEEVENG